MADEEQTRWLSEEEQRAWESIATLLFRLPGPLENQLQRDSGLTLFEYMVISYLSMMPEHTARMSELARLTNSSLSRLSNVVTRCESRGWITRSRIGRRAVHGRVADRGRGTSRSSTRRRATS